MPTASAITVNGTWSNTSSTFLSMRCCPLPLPWPLVLPCWLACRSSASPPDAVRAHSALGGLTTLVHCALGSLHRTSTWYCPAESKRSDSQRSERSLDDDDEELEGIWQAALEGAQRTKQPDAVRTADLSSLVRCFLQGVWTWSWTVLSSPFAPE